MIRATSFSPACDLPLLPRIHLPLHLLMTFITPFRGLKQNAGYSTGLCTSTQTGVRLFHEHQNRVGGSETEAGSAVKCVSRDSALFSKVPGIVSIPSEVCMPE